MFDEEVIVHLGGAQTGGKLTLWSEITPPEAWASATLPCKMKTSLFERIICRSCGGHLARRRCERCRVHAEECNSHVQE
jgi:hypothetical protein